MKKIHKVLGITVVLLAVVSLYAASTKITRTYDKDMWAKFIYECPVYIDSALYVYDSSVSPYSYFYAYPNRIISSDQSWSWYKYVLGGDIRYCFVSDPADSMTWNWPGLFQLDMDDSTAHFFNPVYFTEDGDINIEYKNTSIPDPDDYILYQNYSGIRQDGTTRSFGHQKIWIADTTSNNEAAGWCLDLANGSVSPKKFMDMIGTTAGTGTVSVNPDTNDIDFKVYSDAGLGLHLDASTGYWDMKGILSTNATDIKINPDSTDMDFKIYSDAGLSWWLDAGFGSTYHYHYGTVSEYIRDTDPGVAIAYLQQVNGDDGTGSFTIYKREIGIAVAGADHGYVQDYVQSNGSGLYKVLQYEGTDGDSCLVTINPNSIPDIDFRVNWDSGEAIRTDATTGLVTMDKSLHVDENIRYAEEIIDLTTTVTITGTDSLRGATFTNQGNADADTVHLPGATVGDHFEYLIVAAFDVDINPDDADRILECNALGDAISSDATVGSWIEFIAVSDSTWFVKYGGTWSDVN